MKSVIDNLASLLDPAIAQRVDQAVGDLNSAGYDRWGVEPRVLKAMLALTHWFYDKYFAVTCVGTQTMPAGRVVVVANHSGQLPFDAMMLMSALILALDPPRLGRGMTDYWVPSLPFISPLFTKVGEIVGTPSNCLNLLQDEQCVVVFPEGTRGLGKPFSKRYKLQKFGTGFLRLALEAKAPIVPVAIVGAEEIYPGIGDFKVLAKMLGFPYFPMTPFFPWLGLLGAVPIPTRLTLRFAPPMHLTGDPDMPDADLQPMVDMVQGTIAAQLQIGLKARGGNWRNIAATSAELSPGHE